MKKSIFIVLAIVSNLFAANLTIDNQTASIANSQNYQFAYVGLNNTGTLNVTSTGNLNAVLAVGSQPGSNGIVNNNGICQGYMLSVGSQGTGTFNNYGTMLYTNTALCGGVANTSGGNGTLNFYSGNYTGTYLSISQQGHTGTLNVYGGSMNLSNGINGGIRTGDGIANLLIAGGNVTLEEITCGNQLNSFNLTGGTLTVTKKFMPTEDGFIKSNFTMSGDAVLRLSSSAYYSGIVNQITGQVQTSFADGYYTITAIPEPATLLLMGISLIFSRRNK